MSLIKEFIQNVQQQNLFKKNDFLLLAVSGGADSVALCELCFQAGFHFEIAHCNFQLRGEESERDEKFVRQLGEKYWTKVFVKKFDTKKYTEENKISIQVAARELRYQWFDELLKADNPIPAFDTGNSPFNIRHSRFLLTAHHANDNIETLLMNFLKGTGINGLKGILPKQEKIIRPLLFAKKDEILEFVRENNLEFVEDSSNASDKYTRNYFRNQLIPSIEKVFPRVQENLIHNIERFNETEVLYQQALDVHKKKLLEQKGNEIHIPVLKLLKTEPLKTIVYEIIEDFGFTAHQTDEAINLLNSESGKYISSATHKIIRNRNWLIIAPINTLKAGHVLINKTDKKIDFELGTLLIKKGDFIPSKIPSSHFMAVLDAKDIKFPLLLRKWKQGDYFYPLGMQKKKKLSKFFIDQKMSVTDKEKIWVIESNRRIIWVIGERIDDRFKINGKTENVLFIELTGGKNMA
ncbi:MAG: tRNA lysidine(34) synthetase TilS [Bacteroidota bacterium]|nr:tRNA lysidine(34) synthetase TilS [Bacteroidota bacterium]